MMEAINLDQAIREITGRVSREDAQIAELNKEIARLNKLLDSTIEWYRLPGVVVSQKLEITRLGRIKTAAQALVEAMETCHICSVQMEFLTCCGIPDLHAALKAALEGK